jgi:putative redox protein
VRLVSEPAKPPPAKPPPAKPPVVVALRWDGERRFVGHAASAPIALDGAGQTGPSPVQALAASLAGCMAIDLVHVLTKGRLDLRGLELRLVAERALSEPRSLRTVDLRFVVTGDVPADRVERAIALSREKYCSVWHSLRPDIALTTSFEIRAPAASAD